MSTGGWRKKKDSVGSFEFRVWSWSLRLPLLQNRAACEPPLRGAVFGLHTVSLVQTEPRGFHTAGHGAGQTENIPLKGRNLRKPGGDNGCGCYKNKGEQNANSCTRSRSISFYAVFGILNSPRSPQGHIDFGR